MTCDDCCDSDGEWRGCNPKCRCQCHDELDDDFDDERDAPCIGADCCNPAIDHRRDECCTVEMMESYHAEGEASAEDEVKP